MSNARGKHVSPGIYTKEIDLSYAVKSLGITTLGLVGETKKGPAFEPMMIEDWNEFVDYFGGTDASKFKESMYPKYELPYIAKSYLTESKQLQVCRVLGLSGYNAGPAWIISAYNSEDTDNVKGYGDQGVVVAIIRSRGHYEKLAKTGDSDPCGSVVYKYDQLVYDADDVKIAPYTNVNMMLNCDNATPEKTIEKFEINSNNYGQFTLVAYKNGVEVGRYPVSLNSGVKDYILNVIGGKQEEGDAPIYVEELYDLALIDLILKGEVNQIYYKGDEVPTAEKPISLTKFNNTPIVPIGEPVLDLVSISEEGLKRSNVGQRYIADSYASGFDDEGKVDANNAIKYHAWDYKNNTILKDKNGNIGTYPMRLGHIYTVRVYIDDNGKRNYYYTEYSKLENDEVVPDTDYIEVVTTGSSSGVTGQVLVLNYDRFFMLNKDIITEYKKYSTTGETTGWTISNESEYNDALNKETVDYFPTVGKDGYVYKFEHSSDIQPVSCDLNDYKEQFRCASTPWFVSELKGDGINIDIKKLFRFHTISDGNDANNQIKISIANIKPDDGTFDVLIRDYYDSDGNMTILERYNNCNMVPGTSNYIGLKIGTTNNDYATKSKYVTVEVIENDMTASCVPCGFLGYPIRSFNGLQVNGEGQTGLVAPHITYNTLYDDDIREKKQYFGMSDITGVDIDVLTYKGKDSYGDILDGGYTPGFHLDSTLNSANTDLYQNGKLTVDGESGYTWETVSPNSVTSQNIAPIIGTEADMAGTIYESVGTRKFTAYPYGGFDGWDIYRGYRSNTDDFKANKYKGDISSNTGQGTNFSKIQDGSGLNLTGNCINTDYYAYLAGIKQFENPDKIDINIFATPGIDYYNNQLLTEEAIEMIEEERADSIYIVTTPDKPFGATDSVDEMYTPSDVVSNLEDTAIDTSYAATYYPWVKYFDTDNQIYINLPVTKDAVRNFAMTDNKKYPWYASAGIERGNVDCYKAHLYTKLDDEDTIYEGRINPVKSFSQDGIKIWGNKTLYTGDTPLNRINVRRLMLYIRKLISVAALKLIFEPNDTTLKSQFESIVNPILSTIKSNRGLTDCKLVVSQTPEQMDQHELSCKIWIKPTPALEYIDITFMVTPQGVDFEE